jgi:hypothetical protein
MSNIVNISFDTLIIPAIPLLWYREDHLYIPPETIEYINPDIINNLWPNNNLNINNKFCYKITHRNVLSSPNLYVMFHTFSYYIDTNNIQIPHNFNKSYNWTCIAYTNDNNVVFFNYNNTLSNNDWCSGNAIIHDNSFSPPGDFKFTIKNNTKETYIIIHGICKELFIETTCLFIIINQL